MHAIQPESASGFAARRFSSPPMRAMTTCGPVLALLLIFLFFTPSVSANTITVTANCTLAQAITTANDGSTQGSCASGADNAADTIIFDSSLSEVVPSADLPQITETLTINGGTAGLTIHGKSGNNYYKLFVVKTNSADLTLQNLTIKNAGQNCVGAPSTCDKWMRGGAVAIEDGANLSIFNSVFDNTYAGNTGGAIHVNNGGSSSGNVTIRNSAFRNSYALSNGGILNWTAPANAVLTVEDSLFENGRGNDGGAIRLSDSGSPITVNIKRSVFRNNTAHADDTGTPQDDRGIGGAISTSASTEIVVTIENSTFYNNEAKGKGGALYLDHSDDSGSVTLKHLTIVGNTAPASQGGGIIVVGENTKVKLLNSLLHDNGAGEDCVGAVLTEDVGSFSQDDSCGSVAGAGGPKLGAVSGTGAGAHYPLLAGSPAIDAADTSHCLARDQLGVARPRGPKCDIGAIEAPVYVDAGAGGSIGSASTPSRRSSSGSAASRIPPAVLLNQAGYEITATHGLRSGIQCKRVGPEGVGIQWVLDLGFIDAIDCWGYVEQGVQVCFPQLGAVVFLDASTSPRHDSDEYSAHISAGKTCVSIIRAGTIVLVEKGRLPEAAPAPAPAPDSSSTALSNCMVTTLYTLNFRDGPGGNIIGGIGYGWTLTALAKSGDWYQVDNNGETGWISANHVSTHGICA